MQAQRTATTRFLTPLGCLSTLLRKNLIIVLSFYSCARRRPPHLLDFIACPLTPSMCIGLNVLLRSREEAFTGGSLWIGIVFLKPAATHFCQPPGLLQLKQQIVDERLQPKVLLRHHDCKELAGQQEELTVLQDKRLAALSSSPNHKIQAGLFAGNGINRWLRQPQGL